MGVAGSGKSTVGGEVARRLGWRFIEGDDFHGPTNVAKMRRGEPLTDEDRAPWLAALAAEIAAAADHAENAVVACSALKRRYRDTLLAGATDSLVVHLRGPRELLFDRMQARQHFMPPELLSSQFDDLEQLGGLDGLTLDATRPVDALAAEIEERVRAGG